MLGYAYANPTYYDMTKTIRIYACALQTFPETSEEITIPDGGENRISIYAQPANTPPCPEKRITVYAQPSDGLPCPCAPPVSRDTSMIVYWPSEDEEVPDLESPEPGAKKTETSYKNHPAIRYNTPDICQWVGSVLDSTTADEKKTVVASYPDDGGVAEGDECLVGTVYDAEQNQNEIVPGAELKLTHYLNCPSPGNIYGGGDGKWETIAITGGVITAINGDHSDLDHSYQVEIYDQDIEVWPSDWVDWQVGDWVFVVAIVKEDTDNVALNNKGDLSVPAKYNPRIVPLKIGSVGGGQGFTAYDLLDDSAKPMSLRTVPAKILAINDDNTADVETTEWPEIKDVAFKWHCQDENDYRNASDAYSVDDMVNLVIPAIAWDAHESGPSNPPSDIAIMGWVEQEIKPCCRHLMYIGDPAVRKNAAGDILEPGDPESDTDRFWRVFDVLENFNDSGNFDNADNLALALNQVCAVPVWTCGVDSEGNSKTGHGMFNCTRSDSVTYDDWTVHAVAWLVQIQGHDPQYFWAVCVDYRGVHWPFPNPFYDPLDPESEPISAIWPAKNFFADTIACNEYSQYGSYTPVHAFDVWILAANQANGWEAGDTMMSVAGNYSTLYVWNLTQSRNTEDDVDAVYEPVVIDIINRITADYPDELRPEANCHVLGVKEHKVYLVYGVMWHGKMRHFHQVYEYDFFTEVITKLDLSGHHVVYNPFLESLWHVDFGDLEDETSGSGYSYSHFNNEMVHGQGESYCSPSCVSIVIGGTRVGGGAGMSPFVPGMACTSNATWDAVAVTTQRNGYYGSYAKGQVYACGCQISYKACNYVQTTANWGSLPNPGVYNAYVSDMELPEKASVTPDGTGETRTLNQQDGPMDDPVTTDKIATAGLYDEDYGVELWPHICPYARVKHAINFDCLPYSEVVIQQDADGVTTYGGSPLGSGEALFAVVATQYGQE